MEFISSFKFLWFYKPEKSPQYILSYGGSLKERKDRLWNQAGVVLSAVCTDQAGKSEAQFPRL